MLFEGHVTQEKEGVRNLFSPPAGVYTHTHTHNLTSHSQKRTGHCFIIDYIAS